MRVLVTGAGGFVARHVVDTLESMLGQRLQLVLSHRDGNEADPRAVASVNLDIVDRASVASLISEIRPDAIIHLAGISDVSVAEKNPELAWQVNVLGTLNLARALKDHAPDGVFVFAGSSQIYGSKAEGGRPFSETDLLNPIGEYGATKAAADLALGALAAQGLKAIRFRPFNHIGPGQSASFAVPSFAAQIARIEAKLQDPVIMVGNLDAERDFVDVRDVAQAYCLSIKRAPSLAPGAIFNLASGHPTSIRRLLDIMISLSSTSIRVEIDPKRVRPNDIRSLAGNAGRARDSLGWVPAIALEKTLADILDEQRRMIS